MARKTTNMLCTQLINISLTFLLFPCVYCNVKDGANHKQLLKKYENYQVIINIENRSNLIAVENDELKNNTISRVLVNDIQCGYNKCSLDDDFYCDAGSHTCEHCSGYCHLDKIMASPNIERDCARPEICLYYLIKLAKVENLNDTDSKTKSVSCSSTTWGAEIVPLIAGTLSVSVLVNIILSFAVAKNCFRQAKAKDIHDVEEKDEEKPLQATNEDNRTVLGGTQSALPYDSFETSSV